MDSAELKGKILEVIKGHKPASLATIKDGEPWVRYVMTTGTDDLTLFVATHAQSRKIAQIKADSHVHLTLMADPSKMDGPYVQVAGTAEILDDQDTKNAFWAKEYEPYFSGPADPGFVILKITASIIELMTPGSMMPEIYNCE